MQIETRKLETRIRELSNVVDVAKAMLDAAQAQLAELHQQAFLANVRDDGLIDLPTYKHKCVGCGLPELDCDCPVHDFENK